MFQKLSIVLAFLFLNAVTSTYVPRAAPGSQFITGPCQSDADCASACCGFNSGKCAGPVIAQERDGGCGFGDPSPNNNAAQAIQGPNAEAAPGVTSGSSSSSGSNNAGSGAAAGAASSSNAGTSPAPSTAPGTQFITGPCTSDADCASGCCGFNSGKCAGAVVAQERDGGCGFGDPTPNNNAAQAIQGPNAQAAPGVNNGSGAAAASTSAAASASTGAANNGASGSAAGTSSGSGKPPGTQFITGPCGSDADCASGCCGFNSGKCAGAVVAQERDGGCGFGDAQPNDNAAKALSGRRALPL
ncbi:hypothetical protein K435DRAFT_768048 [Dendrothele bispora CBS 962.96]|uniref:Biotrophy-associated secreted protein 2 n=1 Tax=Dendrothele bispora (strain CBS 962.96) TaxID=1314807 RepID=A0A4S8KWX4_DENBC|nr:hypothetical protein K435DRAFT_768048 [Dendrothele bispora CBS 962.96]